MRNYLRIKNAIIALLLTVMYSGWIVEGISTVRRVGACIIIFCMLMILLELADYYYIMERAHQARKPKCAQKLMTQLVYQEKEKKSNECK